MIHFPKPLTGFLFPKKVILLLGKIPVLLQWFLAQYLCCAKKRGLAVPGKL